MIGPPPSLIRLRIVKVVSRNLNAKVRIFSDLISDNTHILEPGILHGGLLLVLVLEYMEPFAQIGLVDWGSEDDLVWAIGDRCNDVILVFLKEVVDL